MLWGENPSYRLQPFGMSPLHHGFSAWTTVTEICSRMGPSQAAAGLFLLVWSFPCIGRKSLLHFGPLHGLLAKNYISWSPHSPFFFSYLAVHRIVSLNVTQHFYLFFSFLFFLLHYNRNLLPDCDIQLCRAMGPLEPSGTTCVQHWAHPDPFSKTPPLQLSPVTKTLQNNVNQIHQSTDK